MNENCADQPLCQPILVFPAKSLEMAYCLFTNVVFNYSHFVRLHFLSPESSAPVWQTKNRCFLLLKIDASSICLSTKAWRIAYFYKIPHISEKISISPDAFHKQLLIYSAVKLGYILKSIRQCALHEPWWGRAHALQSKRERGTVSVTSVCRVWIEQITLLEELQGYFVYLGSSHSDFNMTVLHLCLFATFWRAVSI